MAKWYNYLSPASNLFGKREDPGAAASPFLNQIPDMAHGQFDPYVNRGNEAYDQANPVYNQMTQDPSGYVNQLMQNYKPSEGYQFKQDVMGKALGNTAAAGGYRGGEYDQLQQGQLISGLLGEDMQNWLSNTMGVQGTGLAGQQGMMNQGYDASGQLSGMLGNTLGAQAGMAFQGAQQKNQDRSQLLQGLLSLGGAAAGTVLGPAGTAAGGALGSKVGGWLGSK